GLLGFGDRDHVGERLAAREDRLDRPALVARQRSRLDETHAVADLALVLLVVRLVALPLLQELVVLLVADEALDDDDDRLVHLVRHHEAFAALATPGAHALAFPCRARSPSCVFTRARSRRLDWSLAGLVSCAVARRSRRWKISSVSSRSRACSSSLLML